MIRRYFITSIVLTAVVAVGVGLIYPLAVYGIGQAVFSSRAGGSLISRNGKVVGSSLIGQNFFAKDGSPDPRYFQPRPSASGPSGYDPTGATCVLASCSASGASNLGPGDPRLVGFIPGFNSVDLNGNVSKRNPFATKDDPYCVPTDPSAAPVVSPAAGQKYAKSSDGSYVCYSSTIPERVLSYQQLNSLSTKVPIPVDAVTASGSGLDPDISVTNADLQAPRVAKARNLAVATVRNLVAQHTNGHQWGFLGEKTVNVLDLNLALNNLHG